MRSLAKQTKWVDSALKDGFEKKPLPSADHLPGKHFILANEGFQVFVHFGKTASSCSLSLHSPNGSSFETHHLGQENGYNWENLLKLKELCAHCFQKKSESELSRFGLGMMCGPCIKEINDYSAKNPLKAREYIGEAKVEFRHVHGRKALNQVKEFRVTAQIINKSYWEPYNGSSVRSASDISHAVQATLSVAGYKVTYKEVHTTWNGEEFIPKKVI